MSFVWHVAEPGLCHLCDEEIKSTTTTKVLTALSQWQFVSRNTWKHVLKKRIKLHFNPTQHSMERCGQEDEERSHENVSVPIVITQEVVWNSYKEVKRKK